ncbi:Piso0_000128 [Millerozyma farinosa CBS 7064]|uniref:Piso0_000128 protein n=1 Tax=Pichia sorbitophila (strain ATCC MYA-4447 / BCRC 22081 / CBS 7064 / NBRC 10061 / NRRL Y-12695) TaxID=559304 RepID=G8YT58_PICSO|nr:Piso0_000128 [Millerozyma farinosa CBS 7064]
MLKRNIWKGYSGIAKCERFYSSRVARRPELSTLLPNKKIMNRILFDNDSRLSYKKIVPIMEAVYENIEKPEEIFFPRYTTGDDLMLCKKVLSVVRQTTNTIDKKLLAVEDELVEKGAEFGNNDAIATLAFKTIEDPNSTREDYKHANKLIEELTKIKHPLVFKLAGDLAFKKGYYSQSLKFWSDFIEVEPDTVQASHVYSNLGIYYFSYCKPRPDLQKAKVFLEKSIKYGELDIYTIKAHYYLGQMFSIMEPLRARYHLELASTQGLKESFPTLGFLEMNVFNNFSKSIQWFKLGTEASNDLSCLVGQFDCYMLTKDHKSARRILDNLKSLHAKILRTKERNLIPSNMQQVAASNEAILNIFFKTRHDGIMLLSGQEE